MNGHLGLGNEAMVNQILGLMTKTNSGRKKLTHHKVSATIVVI